jgi:hypothetical protein
MKVFHIFKQQMMFFSEVAEVTSQTWLSKQDLSKLDPSNLTPLTPEVCFC